MKLHRRSLLVIPLGLGLKVNPAQAESKYKVFESTKGNYQITCTGIFDGIPVNSTLRLLISNPPSIPGQAPIETLLKVSGVEASQQIVTENGPGKRQFIVVDTVATSSSIEVTATYKSTLWMRALGKGSNTKVVQTPSTCLTSSSPVLNLADPIFKEWVEKHQLRKTDDESELDFLYRTHMAIQDEFHYEWNANLDRKLGSIITRRSGDCGCGNMLFAAVALLNNMKAELLFGFNVTPGNQFPYHAFTQVFVEGIGWVTNDATPPGSGKPAGEFGAYRNLFLANHYGTNILLPAPGDGRGFTPGLCNQGICMIVRTGGSLSSKRPSSEKWDYNKLKVAAGQVN